MMVKSSFPIAMQLTTSQAADAWWWGLNAVLDPASENRELSIPVCEQDLELVQAVPDVAQHTPFSRLGNLHRTRGAFQGDVFL